MLHEITHVFDPLSEKNISDSSVFFLKESLVEYIALYIYCNGDGGKIKKTIGKIKRKDKSIFDLKENIGNNDIIYNKTPFVINEFAANIGQDLFVDLLKSFYREIRDKEQISFSDFECVFKTNVPSKHWNKFIERL